MIDTILKFSKSPAGEIIIRVACVFFIGSGVKYFLMKIADFFELLSRSNKTKILIDKFTSMISSIGTVAVSLFVAVLYRKKGQSDFYVYGEGFIYGLGAIGIYYFFISGKFKTMLQLIRKKK